MRFASQEHVHRLEAYAALTAHAKTRCRIWLDQQRRELVKELKAGDVFVLDFLSYLARHGNELSSTDAPSYMLSVKFYNRCRNHAMKSRSCEYKTTQCNCRAEHYWTRPRFRGPKKSSDAHASQPCSQTKHHCFDLSPRFSSN